MPVPVQPAAPATDRLRSAGPGAACPLAAPLTTITPGQCVEMFTLEQLFEPVEGIAIPTSSSVLAALPVPLRFRTPILALVVIVGAMRRWVSVSPLGLWAGLPSLTAQSIVPLNVPQSAALLGARTVLDAPSVAEPAPVMVSPSSAALSRR